MKNTVLKYAGIILILLAGCNSDYHTKKWAESNIKGKSAISLITNFIELGYTKNRGMAFGIMNNRTPNFLNTALIIFRIILLCALTLILVIFRRQSLLFLLPFLFIWIGAIGNIIDAFKYGYVVDFIHIHAGNLLNYPFYFNLADAYVSVGVFLLLVREIPRLGRLQKPLNG
jgi:signal peptidase II